MLLGALVASGLLLVGRWTIETRRVASRRQERDAPTPLDLLIGLVTNFLDTLGIGSLATTTALYRAGCRRLRVTHVVESRDAARCLCSAIILSGRVE